MKTLVSLVGEQTIPNVLFIKERIDCERYLFISTKEMNDKSVVEKTCKAAGIENNEAICQTLTVDANSPSDIDNKLKQLDISDDEHFVVNITGGNKLMVLLCFQFFKERGAEISYKTNGNIIQKIFPTYKKTDFPITSRLTLKEYLDACGIVPTEKSWTNKNTILISEEFTESFFELFIQSGRFVQEMKILRDYRDKSPNTLRSSHPQLETFFNRIQYPRGFAEIRKSDIKYITGGWFEEYIYSTIRHHLGISDDNLAINLNIGSNTAPNELDVVFVRNNNIYVFECKTGLSDGERSLFNDTLYKIAALRKDFGLMATSYLFTLGNLRDDQGNLQQKYQKRAGALGVEIVDEMVLMQPEKISEILNKIKSKR